MKHVFFDFDTATLLSKDGRVRPFTATILEYCYTSKIRVFLAVSPSNEHLVEKFFFSMDVDNNPYIKACAVYVKGTQMPAMPDLVVSCDGEYLRKFPGLLIPNYNPDASNKFADLSLAGRILDQIKDRVVLNRFAPEPQKKYEEPKKEEKPEDPTNFAFEL